MTIPSRTDLLPRLLADLEVRDGTVLGDRSAYPAESVHPAEGAAVPLRLPPASTPRRSVGAAMARRRAGRFYAARPVSAADLHAICAQAQEPSGTERSGPADLQVYAVTARVSEVGFGIHRYTAGGGLEPAGSLGDRRQLRACVLQEEFSHAPVTLLFVGDLAHAVHTRGSHGYRLLMTRAGAAAQAAWIAAEQRALVGCMFAGVRSGHLAEWADVDGYRRAFLVALSVGHLAEPAG